jgi:hypothetical protein
MLERTGGLPNEFFDVFAYRFNSRQLTPSHDTPAPMRVRIATLKLKPPLQGTGTPSQGADIVEG